MKSLIFTLLLVAVTGMGQAQKITQLEEAKVGFAPLDSKIVRDGDAFSFMVKEVYQGEFEKDPIAFMKSNFDIQNFMAEVDDENYDSYQVTFSSDKGHLRADYNKNGEIVKTFQKFKDIVLPLDVRREVYMKNKGWTMTSNKYIASGPKDLVENEIYHIKLENQGQKRKLRLDGKALGKTSVASN